MKNQVHVIRDTVSNELREANDAIVGGDLVGNNRFDAPDMVSILRKKMIVDM